jgi:hypothetical protein
MLAVPSSLSPLACAACMGIANVQKRNREVVRLRFGRASGHLHGS